jgi:hypothetical protein
MTVQTLWGYVQMYVYETGREIMELGVVPAANMLPEVAYVKLCPGRWARPMTAKRWSASCSHPSATRSPSASRTTAT